MRLKTTAIVMMVCATMMAMSGIAYADSQEQDYVSSIGRKLGRGTSNTALGWIELPTGIREIGQEHGVGAAATWGILHGTGRAIQRTSVGIFEMITFPFAVPQNFEPILEPEFLLTDQAS